MYTDHMLRNQYPRRSAQSFDEGYAPSRNRGRQYRNTQSNSLDFTRRGNSTEIDPTFFAQQQSQIVQDPFILSSPIQTANIIYQTSPYSGPPICVPYVCKENPLQDPNESQKSEDEARNTNTVASEENDQQQHFYIQPVYDPAYFTSLHNQAVTYHAQPGIPVGYLLIQDNIVTLVPQADVTNITQQFNSLQINSQPPQTPGYNTSTPPNAYISSAVNLRSIPYATLEGSYSTPQLNPSSNITYVAQNQESPGIVYQLPVGSCGMTYTSPSQDPSLGIPYQGYQNTMYLPMYTMLPTNVVPAQQPQYPSSAPPPPLFHHPHVQYDATMPGSSGSNIN